MAATFPEVVGIDVSPDQIQLAQQALAKAPAAASFHVTDGARIPLPDSSVGNVFSANVFQHLEQNVAESLIAEVSRVLTPGCTTMLHIPVPGSNLTTTCGRVAAQRAIDPLLVVAHRLRKRVGGYPPMRRRIYDAVTVFGLLERVGLVDLEMSLFRPTVEAMYVSVFLARKPA